MGGLYSRLKNWISTEDVTYSNLNAEFDNVLTNFIPAMMDDYSTNVTQMQTATDPGEVGTESVATSLAGELERLRFILKEITGNDYWYESPTTSLLGIANAIRGSLSANRLVSGLTSANSSQPVFLIANGAARTVKLDGTPTNFVYYVNGVSYTIASDVTLTNLTAAPLTNNTCLVNDSLAADQDWTKYQGENGTDITVDAMGSEITALVGKLAGFKIYNGSATEYFIAQVASSTSLAKARRGYFFDSSNNPIPRIVYTDNDTITLMKLTWIYAKTDGTLDVGYTEPTYGKDTPTSPAVGDFWFDTANETWMKYSGTAFASAGSTLVGVCIQDTTNTVGARSFEFFLNYDSHNTFNIVPYSSTQVKTRLIGEQANVWGTTIKIEKSIFSWDITIDLEAGVTEGANTDYYFYMTQAGEGIISDIRPYDRREDLGGFYHPYESWRCLGFARNDGSSNLTEVESIDNSALGYRSSRTVTADFAADAFYERIRVNSSSGAFSVKLPPTSLCKGQVIRFFKSNSEVNAVTCTPAAGDTVVGAASRIMRIKNEEMVLRAGDSDWELITHTAPEIDSEIYVDGGNGFGSTNTFLRRFSNTRRDTSSPYMTYADSAANGGSVTVNVPGLYAITYCDDGGPALSLLGISINTSAGATTVASVTYAQGKRAITSKDATGYGGTSVQLYLAAGDVIACHTNTGPTGTGANTIFKVTLLKPLLGT